MHRYNIELSYQRFLANYGRNNAEILTEHLGVDASAMIEMAARKVERLVTEDSIHGIEVVVQRLSMYGVAVGRIARCDELKLRIVIRYADRCIALASLPEMRDPTFLMSWREQQEIG
ncbi:MAG: hypothetical protein ACK47M_06405 [Caldilinea sp.]